MDIFSLGGLIAVFIAVFIGIFTSGGTFIQFWSVSSLFIVVVGGLMATMIVYSKSTFSRLANGAKAAFMFKLTPKEDIVIELVELCKIIRKSGFLAVEEQLNDVSSEFLKKGLQFVIDGMEPDDIKKMLEIDMDNEAAKYDEWVEIYETYSAYLPAYGMIGTLIGLVIMLADLSDASALGVGMAAALITTFYGSLFANGITAPIGKRIAAVTGEELLCKEILLAGILDIQMGTNPRILEDKMILYLNDAEKKAYKNKVGDN